MLYWIQLPVVLYAVICSAISEFITKYFLTGQESYQSLCDNLKKIEEKLDNLGYDNQKKKDRAIKEKQSISQQIAFMKFKPQIINAVFMVITTILVNYVFEAQKVGTLPFQPFGFFSRITHRNLTGDDMTDCSLFFFYILVRMAVRPIMQKVFGNDDQNSASFMNSFVPDVDAFKQE
ncbi:Calcium load-activated calcium channel [Entamoeba marina]